MHYRFRRKAESFFHGMDVARRVILGIVFWILVILLLVVLLGGRGTRIRGGSMLILHPVGSIVDVYTVPPTYQGLPVSGYSNETLLSDMLGALNVAAMDPRIEGVWLYLDDLYSAGPAAAAEFADAVRAFRESGKPIIASADTFDTTRYRIAAPADRIVVDRLGEVFPAGYGSWRTYYAEGLEKLGAEALLFRSGVSKTGGESYIRDDMSEAALRDEQRLLGDLWDLWLEGVASDRDLDPASLDDWIQNYDVHFVAAGGNGAGAALGMGLVDAVETGSVVYDEIAEATGRDDLEYVESSDYVQSLMRRPRRAPSVAVIPVSGSLVYGYSSSGSAGSEDIVAAIESARETPGVGALVLRIDSPGGDVRAGEEIRRAIEETRTGWNLPVVASMSDMAASGGYWIAVESDGIVARDETITGSIGVYSLSITFEKALADWLGVHIDGWGTTPWSGTNHPGRSLDERTASMYQASVGDIDRMFRDLVGEKRDLDSDTVDELAGGIPWSGKRAMESGLADRSGGLAEAVDWASELAGMEEPQVLFFDMRVDPRQQMLGQLLWGRVSDGRRLFGSGMLRGYRAQVANQ